MPKKNLLQALKRSKPTQSPQTTQPVADDIETMTTNVFYRQLGKSGLKVSVPVLGGMSFGSPKWIPWVISGEKGMDVLKAAWDVGINTIDTANAYSNGESERIIGNFMVKYNIPRDNLVIMTKGWAVINPDDPGSHVAFDIPSHSTKTYVNQGGLSRAALFNQVNGSLKRLRTDYIDLYQIHAFDPMTPMEETMKALHDLITEGKIRYIGASNLRVWQFAQMNSIAEKNGWTQFISMQIEHSLLYRTEEREMFEYCKHKGIGIVAYTPMADGRLARPLGVETPRLQLAKGGPFERKMKESDDDIIKRVEELAKKKSLKMSQVALAWSMSKTTSPIVGANSPERVREAVVQDNALTEEELKHLEEPYEYRPFRN